MAVTLSRPALRWLVPVSAAVVAVGGGAAVRAVSASAEASLPARSAAQLLVDVQTARLDSVSGTVVSRADLGLPDLPQFGGQGSADLTSLITGSHTLRVWYSGPDKARVALLGTLGETDVIANGTDLWTWSSDRKTATHRTLSEHARPDEVASHLPVSPQQAADRALAAIDPSTKVGTDGTAVVAGRAAYELVLTPRDAASLVAEVRIAIDGRRHIPLRVQVYARGHADPAAEIGFTQVSFARPDASRFRFTPPPGTTVTEEGAATAPGPGALPRGTATLTPGAVPSGVPAGPGAPGAAGSGPVVLGSGWTTVVATRRPATPAPTQGGPARASQFDALLSALPQVSGSWGSGQLLSGRLFSVLVTDDGRMFAGAVSPQRLYQAAADPKTQSLKATR
jgi:outer membrane lipoprotein-sorting protein